MTIRLLGPPRLEGDGVPLRGPRGHKVWGLLAYLALAETPPSRQRLVSLLFEEAEDPRRALRWNLAELRRVLGSALTVTGDPVVLELGERCEIDVRLIAGRGRPGRPRVEPGEIDILALGGELLEGLSFDDSPSFDAWLAAERHRLAADCRTLIYETAVRALAAGRPTLAAQAAARAVELDPLDADYHTVLVASFARAGDTDRAQAHVARCTDLFRRELGVDPPAEVAEAALAVAPPAPPPVLDVEPLPRPGSPSVAAVRSYLDAGCASLSAGAVSAGVGQLQAAVSAAAAVGDDRLSGLTQLALASALIHSTGGRGAQVTALLHRSLTAAREADDPRTAAAACRELGILAVYGGRRAAAERWLHAAGELADDDAEHARILGVRGMSLTDGGNYPEAIEALDASVVHARRAGAWRQQAWSQSMLGRLFVLREEPAAAALVLDEALEVVRSERWTAFVPWPEAFRAEAALQLDEVRTASELLDHAWVLAQETLDHCWIPTVAHGMARLVARDDPQEALRWCRRGLEPRPWYLWPRVRLLDAGCDIAAGRDTSVVARWAAELLEAAAGAAMHELTARAYIHRARLGDTKAMTAAHDVAAGIANPALHSLLTVQAAIA